MDGFCWILILSSQLYNLYTGENAQKA